MITQLNVPSELKPTFTSPHTAVSPFSSTAPVQANYRYIIQQQQRRHLPEMFLNQAKHTFSRPGIINYPHTYMPSEHFPGGVDSMCIFLSFVIFLLGASTVIQRPIVPSSYQQEKGYLID